MIASLHRISTPTGELHCQVEGNLKGPWVIFSNSHATNLSLWDAQASALAPEYGIVRYDQRGHGQTPAAGPCTFDGLADDLIAVMDGLAIATASAVGVSMGAVTVLRAAARHPQRFARVLASDGQWRAPAGAHALWQQRIDEAERDGMAGLARTTAQRWASAYTARKHPERVLRLQAMVAQTSVQGYADCASAMQDYDFSADYPHLAMPVTYVVGACDGALPTAMRQMAEATPHAHYVEIADSGHLPCVEQPQAFLDCLRIWLAPTPAAATPPRP